MSNVEETTLFLDLDALSQNYHYLKSKIENGAKFLGVVKAFAYGSDMVAIAKKLEALGADYLAVAYAKEGVLLRDAGVTLPILVLHPLKANFEEVVQYNLEPNLYSEKIIADFIYLAEQKGVKKYSVHLKFNTGLNRLGLKAENIENIANKINQTESVFIKSVLSHLAASEDLEEKTFSTNQIAHFIKDTNALSKLIGYKPMMHMCNTSGILNYPEAHFDMVRSGIGLYGYGNEAKYDKELKPVATLKTVISQIHSIEKGESIGYNRAFVADKPMRTATLPIGHADGIGRQYGNGKTAVQIHQHWAPIIGNVCMDMIMVDVTGIPCQEGDEVLLFGANHSAAKMAGTAKTISYELLTGIGARVKRKIL